MEKRSALKYSAYDEALTKCVVWSTPRSSVDEESDVYLPNAKVDDKQFDPVTFNMLKVSAENIASQLTLGDLPVFKAISPEELTSCAWNGRNKLQVAPNVVAFIRRFNHVCLWCQKEVLNCEVLKRRVEVVGHFIKIAKKLLELNNIHSAFAIISGLRSNALYRLRKTWTALPSKDKIGYERMEKLFSDQNNWERIRKYMQTVKLPCIPYLGLYLTDLIYIDVAHPTSGGLESSQRMNLMNNILRVLADLQSSTYDNLQSIEYFQKYLDTIRYIDELQKFVEEDLYNLSLRLEPPDEQPSNNTFDKQAVDCAVAQVGLHSMSLTPQACKSKPPKRQGHRKTQSLGGDNLPVKLEKRTGNDTFPLTIDARRHLLDDSLLEFSSCTASSSSLPLICQDGAGDSGNESSDDVILRETRRKSSWTEGQRQFSRSVTTLEDDDKCTLEGFAKRKILLKWGRRPRISIWRHLWIRLVDRTLFVHGLRTHFPRTCKLRSAYKAHARKVLSLFGWMVVKSDDPIMPDSFLLQEPAQGHVYRFRVGSQASALLWVECLKKACQDPRKKLPSNLMSFD